MGSPLLKRSNILVTLFLLRGSNSTRMRSQTPKITWIRLKPSSSLKPRSPKVGASSQWSLHSNLLRDPTPCRHRPTWSLVILGIFLKCDLISIVDDLHLSRFFTFGFYISGRPARHGTGHRRRLGPRKYPTKSTSREGLSSVSATTLAVNRSKGRPPIGLLGR